MKFASTPKSLILEISSTEACYIGNALWDYLDKIPEDKAEWHTLYKLASRLGNLREDKVRGKYYPLHEVKVEKSGQDFEIAEISRKQVLKRNKNAVSNS